MTAELPHEAPPALKAQGVDADARVSASPWNDPWVWLLCVVMVGLTAPYLTPWLDPAAVYDFGELVGMPILLVTCITMVGVGLRGISDGAERRFWYGLLVALAFNLFIRGLYSFPIVGRDRGHILVDVAYLFFYFAFLRVLRVRPDRPRDSSDGGSQWVEALATAVFMSGLLVYFVLVPEAVTPEGYGTWVPSLILYTTLDGYILLTLVHLHQSSSSRKWRVIYGWIGLCALGWAATDVYEALYYAGLHGYIDEASPWNALWYLPYAFLGMAARVRDAPWPEALARIGYWPDASSSRNRTVGIVVLFALVLPVLHFVSNLGGLMDPASRDARELTVLVFLPLLLGIAFVHQRMLERRALRLEAESRVLEEQRALLQTAAEQAPASMLLVHADGTLAYANPAWEQASGRPLDELVGYPILDTLEDLGAEAVALFRSAPSEGPVSTRLTRTTRDGEEVEEDLFITPVRSSVGDLTHYSISLRDVTHEVQLERQLNQGQRMEALGTLAGGIAHDFNNVLAAILGYSELALDRPETDPELREDLTEILKAAERASSLTSQILTFSRQEDTERRPVALGAVVTEAMKLMGPTLPSSIAVSVDVDPTTGAILAEEGRLHQVVMNLVTNAVQAVGEKGSLQISTRETHEDWRDPSLIVSEELPAGDYAVLSVRDDGAGMDPETLGRMYDPFYTTKKLGHGTGLGLSVVHGIVAGHGGGIAVQSEPGVGTAFHVFLPIATEAPQPPEAVKGGDEEHEASAHLLLVDDEEMVANVLCRGLERAGFRVTAVTEPETALKLFKAAPSSFHMLITDQTMPGITGLELAAEVRRVVPTLPVLLLTGYSDSVTPDAMREAGVADVLYKPVSRADLAGAIRMHLDSAGGRSTTT